MSRARDIANQIDAGEVVPHIIPGVLYPAVAGKLLDGSTSHSGNYGTAQSDERSYYYTDIKGSKPIKDPRIGGHFGSQRHKFKSLQLLEQETATHGENVYSVDGREWIRCVGGAAVANGSAGHRIDIDQTTSFIEIIGFFSDINYIPYITGGRGVRFTLDGGTEDTTDRGQALVSTPLISRYVDSGSVVNLPISTSLGIHTVKLRASQTHSARLFGIELIAQDTSNRNNIQIPSQDVVSYGKKFNVSGTPHYNPFNNQTIGDNTSHGKNTVGWTTYDSTLDTATSLGLDAWVDSGNYYRPVNGGRVVKWVDSSGNIKTSVNMMPPSAKAIGTHSGNSGPHQTAWTSTYQPVFSSGSVDHSQAEVAKTFNWREFGNGSANGNASYKDASTLSSTVTDIAYVMDDGLTTLSGEDAVHNAHPIGYINSNSKAWYFTFIGTGFTFIGRNPSNSPTDPIAIVQNLPYGTHVVRIGSKSGAHIQTEIDVDGVRVYGPASGVIEYAGIVDLTIHQPKRPPIPEDACVIADYMLMADFVKQTETESDIRGQISKGSRYVSASRDIFYNASGAFRTDLSGTLNAGQIGLRVINSNANPTAKLHFFGTTATFHLEGSNETSVAVTLGGSATSETALDNTSSTHGDALTITDTVDLGLTNTELTWTQDDNLYAIIVDSPIHTSHHYQSFETPFLHELVGGDRNMEQTNLVCSPDNRSWDSLTRDTSYLGNTVVSTNFGTQQTAVAVLTPDDWRGSPSIGPTGQVYFNKDFAIAYDRMICLVDGQYEISAMTVAVTSGSGGDHAVIKVNDNVVATGTVSSSAYSAVTNKYRMSLIKGDYVQIFGRWHGDSNAQYNHIQITRL